MITKCATCARCGGGIPWLTEEAVAAAANFIRWEQHRTHYSGVRSRPFAPEHMQRQLRRRFPGVTLVAAFTEATRQRLGQPTSTGGGG